MAEINARPKQPLASGIYVRADAPSVPLSQWRKLANLIGRRPRASEMRELLAALTDYRDKTTAYSAHPRMKDRREQLGAARDHATALADMLDTVTGRDGAQVMIDDLTNAQHLNPTVRYEAIRGRLGRHLDLNSLCLELRGLAELASGALDGLPRKGARGIQDDPWRTELIVRVHAILGMEPSAGIANEATAQQRDWAGLSIDLMRLTMAWVGVRLSAGQIGPYIPPRKK